MGKKRKGGEIICKTDTCVSPFINCRHRNSVLEVLPSFINFFSLQFAGIHHCKLSLCCSNSQCADSALIWFAPLASPSGTTLYYQPGLLHGGSLEHDCSPSRSIGYYLESLLCLAPFMKHPLKIVLRGVTNDQVDPSVSNKI